MTSENDWKAMSVLDRLRATNGMKALRGPLSQRATSAEFNEWNARDVVELVDALEAELAVEQEKNARLLETLEKVDGLLTNLQPHIPQACYPGREKFIDNYVDVALEATRAALAGTTPK